MSSAVMVSAAPPSCVSCCAGRGRREKPRAAEEYSRSVYESRDPGAFASDPDEPQADWLRIGDLDPRGGAWVDGPHGTSRVRTVDGPSRRFSAGFGSEATDP